jgi:hypothetical protein
MRTVESEMGSGSGIITVSSGRRSPGLPGEDSGNDGAAGPPPARSGVGDAAASYGEAFIAVSDDSASFRS